jgi:hypothetical protein
MVTASVLGLIVGQASSLSSGLGSPPYIMGQASSLSGGLGSPPYIMATGFQSFLPVRRELSCWTGWKPVPTVG